MKKTQKLLSFVSSYPTFFRDAGNHASISQEYLVDRVVQYGDIHHLKECIGLIGEQQFISTIKCLLSKKHIHYQPCIINYLSILFSLYNPLSLGNILKRAKGNMRIYR